MSIKQMSGDDARKHFDARSAVFVDIRDPASFSASHIEGAISLVDEASAESFTTGTNKSQTVIVYCYHGNSSRGAARFLGEQGFEEVYSMAGGFEEWRYHHPFVAG